MTPAQTLRKNVHKAFVSLAKGAPDCTVSETDAFTLCTSSVKHPISNFAMKLALEQQDINHLAQLATQNPFLRIYVMTGDSPYNVEELLKSKGLMEVYRLDGMMLGPSPPIETAPVELAQGPLRIQTVKFMIDSFFWSSPKGMRQSLGSILASVNLDSEFFVWRDEQGILAAATLVSSENCIGIYNLCVRNEDRGRGYGSHFTSALAGIIKSRNLQGVLQCSPLLAPWYARLGFHKIADAAALAGKVHH